MTEEVVQDEPTITVVSDHAFNIITRDPSVKVAPGAVGMHAVRTIPIKAGTNTVPALMRDHPALKMHDVEVL